MRAVFTSILLASQLTYVSELWAADNVDISSCAVEGVSFGTSLSDVRKLFGEPIRRNQPCNDCIDMPQTWIDYEGLRVSFINLEAVHMEVTSEEYRLAAGLGVGSARSEIVAEYGDPTIIEDENGEFLSYAITAQNSRRTGHTLVFLIRDDVVVGFKIGPKRTGSIYP